MSSITDMVIFTGLREHGAMARVNEWCVANDSREQQFARLDTEAAGGNKVFYGEVWAMAGNYFPHWELSEVFPTFGWRWPDCVVLLIVDAGNPEVAHVYRAREPWAPRSTASPTTTARAFGDIEAGQAVYRAGPNEVANRETVEQRIIDGDLRP